MAEDRAAARDRIDLELGHRISARLGYMHGLFDAIQAAPGEADVTAFLDRIEQVLTALEAVQTRIVPHGEQARATPFPEDDFGRGFTLATGFLYRMITRDIASALRIEAPEPDSPPTRDELEPRLTCTAGQQGQPPGH